MSSLKNCIALGFLMFTCAFAEAASIGPDVSVTGSVTYDTGSFVYNASHSGTMTATVGGATTTTTYSANSTGFLVGSAIGASPLMGVLTDTDDGFGITGAASGLGAIDDAEFGIGIDVTMTISNTSPTSIYQVTVGIDYRNSVDSVGTDAYVDSEFMLFQRAAGDPPPGTEKFYTYLLTDTVNGNESGENSGLGFGGPLSDIGTDTLVLTLNPGDAIIIDGDWTMEGGAFVDATSEASLYDFNVQLTIQDVHILDPGLLEGDANRDGVVSADDYASVQTNFGDTGDPGLPGDANGDGLVSADDYASVQAHFGATAGVGSVPVPEPTTLALLVLGGVAMLRRRSA